jgi:hypothetical protein
MKTAEDFMKKHASFEFKAWKKDHPQGFLIIERAMEDYANNQVRSERDKIKNELNKIQGSWSYQQVIELIDSL